MSKAKKVEWTKEVQKSVTGKTVSYKTEIGGISIWFECGENTIGGWRVKLDEYNSFIFSGTFSFAKNDGKWLPKRNLVSIKKEALSQAWNGIIEKKKKAIPPTEKFDQRGGFLEMNLHSLIEKQISILEPYMSDLDNKRWRMWVARVIKSHQNQGLCLTCDKPEGASCEDFLNGNPEAQARVNEAYKKVTVKEVK